MNDASKTLAQMKKANKLVQLAFRKNGPKSFKRGQGLLLNALRLGGIALDDRTKEVTLDGDPVSLTPREYDILHLLMGSPGTVFSPKRIYRAVWGEEPFGVENAVAVHIRHLREKLEIDPSDPRYIKVVWGQGYKMEGGKP